MIRTISPPLTRIILFLLRVCEEWVETKNLHSLNLFIRNQSGDVATPIPHDLRACLTSMLLLRSSSGVAYSRGSIRYLHRFGRTTSHCLRSFQAPTNNCPSMSYLHINLSVIICIMMPPSAAPRSTAPHCTTTTGLRLGFFNSGDAVNGTCHDRLTYRKASTMVAYGPKSSSSGAR